MITVNDILTQWQQLKTRFNEFYTLITGEVDADATLDGLTSTSKTAEYNKWMFVGSAIAMIMDSLWEERQTVILEALDQVQPTDRWFQQELLKFQYGDSLQWDEALGRYYYAVIDPDKQIIKRCSVSSSGGTTAVKVAKESAGLPVALSGPELAAFTTFVRQVQWAGARVSSPISQNSDKLNAPMTVHYDGTKTLADIQAIVEAAFNGYLANLPFNGEYNVNKHGDFVENSSLDIKWVDMGAVQAKPDAGVYGAVSGIYSPASGYIEKDSAISFATMITYVAH